MIFYTSGYKLGMSLNREEKEKFVLDLYYNKDYTYRDLAKETQDIP